MFCLCYYYCSPEDIERFREEMVKHQPQLAAAAQKAAAMMSANEGGTKPPHSDSGDSKVTSSDILAAVNGETVAAETIGEAAVSGAAAAEVENQDVSKDLD